MIRRVMILNQLTGLAVALGLSACVSADDSRSGLAEARLSTTALGDGLSEIIEWPCGSAEYFGFLANNLAAVSCEPGPAADFAFVDLGTGNIVRQIEGPPAGIVLTSGLWTIDGEDYWAQVIGRYNLHLVMPGQEPEIRLYHPNPDLDRRLALSGLTDGQLSDAYINGLGGCAILEETRRAADGSVSSRLHLLDTANLASADQLAERSIAVDTTAFGQPPSRAELASSASPMLGAACYREPENPVFLVTESLNSAVPEPSTLQLSRITVSAEPAVLSYDVIDTDAFRWTRIFRPTAATLLDLAVTPQGSERLSSMTVQRVGTADAVLEPIADPLPVGWRWIHFDSVTRTGLGIPRDYRSEGRHLLYASCETARCDSHELPVELNGASYFFGVGRLAQRQVFRACIAMPDDSTCRERTLLISMPELIPD
jgi:hypothetical protein